MFDYLIKEGNELPGNTKSKENNIIIAGNLSSYKVGYVYELPHDVKFDLYGINYTGVTDNKIKYHGSYPSDELPWHLKGAYGLVWDGDTAKTCSGIFGDYLRINNPHKTSLYLACGIPVITWNKAAIAQYVRKNRVGITVSSLDEINEKLKDVSKDEYNLMRKNAKKCSERVRNGYYLKKSNTGSIIMKIKSVKFNFIMNFILTASNFIFPLITFPYVSRVLGASGTGKVSFAISVVSYFTMVAALGIPTYGIRTTAKVRDDQEKLNRTTQEILSIHLFMMLLVSIVYILAILFVPRFQSDRTLFLVVGVSILLDPLGVNWLYQGLEQYGYIAKRSIFLKFVGVILMFMFIHSPDDYVFYGVTSILASAGSNVLNFINLRKYVSLKSVGNYDIKQHLKPILILFAQVVAVNIYTNLDNVMLGFIKTDVDVGLYAAAVKVKTILTSLVTSLGAVLLPRLSYYIMEGRKEEFQTLIRKAYNFVIVIALPLMLFTFFMQEIA